MFFPRVVDIQYGRSPEAHLKIGIVGAGHVGSTAAYTLVLQGVGSELVLVDQNHKLADAHVMDILHATPFSHTVHIHSGNFADLAGCALVILAAGVGQQPGETRIHLLQRNAAVFQALVPQIVKHSSDAILLVATNPLDIMTYITASLSGFPPGRVLGSAPSSTPRVLDRSWGSISASRRARCMPMYSANTVIRKCFCGLAHKPRAFRWPSLRLRADVR